MALFYIILALLLSLNGLIGLDPDLGWHLQMGQLILSSGVPLTDPFSYTMPGFNFIDHEWLTNVILFELYSHVGLIPIALLFGTISSLTLWIISKEWPKLNLGLTSLAAAVLITFTGIRPQMITALLFAILIQILFSKTNYLKFRCYLPIFFGFWVNLHGGFAAGIITLIIFNLIRSVQFRKVNFVDWLITGLSVGATFINPYHEQIWVEIWRQLSDRSLQSNIQEWTPGVLSWNLIYLGLITLSLALIIKYRRIFQVEQIVIYFAFLILSLSSLRHIPLWLVIALPLIFTGLECFLKELPNQVARNRFNEIWRVFTVISLIILSCEVLLDLTGAWSLQESRFYPKQAVEFLKTHPDSGQIFSSYNWGGYLIWKLPNQKVFIDGRMPSWQQSPLPGQSTNAMKDYLKLINNPTQVASVLDPYGVKTIVWFSPSYHPNLSVPLLPDPPPSQLFNNELKGQGWKVIYQDQTTVIYQKP